MSDLIVSTALTKLRHLVSVGHPFEPDEAAYLLTALQRRGLTKTDLVVHMERIRAQNDVTGDDEEVEENALAVLDLIEGSSDTGISWDAKQKAAAWIPLAIGQDELEAASGHALSVNDLLPFRATTIADQSRRNLVALFSAELEERRYEPTPADFFRAPKNGLTTRPAALLVPLDRFVYEGLVGFVTSALTEALPAHVIWPRGRAEQGAHVDFLRAPTGWTSEFVVRTDVASYYESIDHAYLSVIISSRLELPGAVPIALEAFLDAVMGSHVGLPQGSLGSDILASAFLVDIDRELSHRGWPLARYSDDLLIGASSFDEARSRLRELEGLLRDRGLTLANEKTKIMRRDTYISSLDRDDAPESLRERVREEMAEWFDRRGERGAESFEEEIDLDDQVQWELLYDGSISWDEALAEIDDQFLPPWVDAYTRIYEAEAERLRSGGYPSEKGALSTNDLRRCMLFMAADPQLSAVLSSHSVIDWHPALVQDMAKFLTHVTQSSPVTVAQFLRERLEREHDSDVELSWLLSPAVDDSRLTEALTQHLLTASASRSRPLTAAIAFRALNSVMTVSNSDRDAVLRSFSPALGAELALSLDWVTHEKSADQSMIETRQIQSDD